MQFRLEVIILKIATLRRKARCDKPLEIPWQVALCDDIIGRAWERRRHIKFLSKTTGKYTYYKSREPVHSSKGKSFKTNIIYGIGELSSKIKPIPQRANTDRRRWYGNYR